MGSGSEASRITERRSYGRVPLQVFVSVECGAGSDHTSGYCRDVSKGGIYLFTEFPLQQGAEVELCIARPPEISDMGEPIVAYGHVKRSERYLDGKMGAAVEISRWARANCRAAEDAKSSDAGCRGDPSAAS
jgi:hypothetical protein